MGKPLGMDLGIDQAGLPTLRVRRPTTAEDRIWDAVEAAIDANLSVEEFRREAASCWKECLRQRAQYAEKDWAK